MERLGMLVVSFMGVNQGFTGNHVACPMRAQKPTLLNEYRYDSIFPLSLICSQITILQQLISLVHELYPYS